MVSSAYDGAEIGMVCDGETGVRAGLSQDRGLAAALPGLAADVLARDGGAPDAVAIVVGPGSFTGLRAGLAVGVGLSMGYGVQAVGVTAGEAMEQAVSAINHGRIVWTAVAARRGRVFIEAAGEALGYAENALPQAPGRVAVCGNAANMVAAGIAARGDDVMLLTLRRPPCGAVARVACGMLAGSWPMRAALPLYVDAPEARLPVPLRVAVQ